MRYTPLLPALLATLAASASAQVTTVDEGRFLISRGGQRVGSEDFAIRRTPGPGGGTLVANGAVTYDDHRLAPALRTDGAGAPMAYQVTVQVGSEVQERLSGQIGRGRFSARMQTPRGESAKEYIVADGAVVLDDEVFHQYYFVGRGEQAGSLAVVIPRRSAQVTMRVHAAGAEQLSIGGVSVSTRRLVLTEPGGASRQVWLDTNGRVLKVALDGSGVVAIRDEVPR
ncbi:MAG: hypothetical protein WKG32_03020 [Gemmatimonadaceae bacterium]